MIRPLMLAAAILLSGCTASVAQGSAGLSLRGALPSLAPLVKKVVPSVVNIAVTESVGAAGLAASPRPAWHPAGEAVP